MTHIQKALKSVDDRGKYQVLLLVLFVVIYLELGLILLGSSFVYMNPIFECDGIKDPTEENACPIIEKCRVGTLSVMQSMTTPPPITLISTAAVKTSEASFNQLPISDLSSVSSS